MSSEPSNAEIAAICIGALTEVKVSEAMTTIDINTGAFVGHHNLEETIFKTNMEAAQAIAVSAVGQA